MAASSSTDKTAAAAAKKAKPDAGLIVLYQKEAGVPPLLQLVVAATGNTQIAFKPAGKFQTRVELKLVSHPGQSLFGPTTIARFLARQHPALYGQGDPVAASQIDQWVDQAQLDGASADQVAFFLLDADAHLRLRSFFVGYAWSLADFAVWVAVRHFLAQHPTFDLAVLPQLARWYAFCHGTALFQPLIQSAAASSGKTPAGPGEAATSSGSAGATKTARGKAQHNKALDLEGAEMGKVVTRFPPEPSGYMHLGHCKASLHNYLTAKRYNGRMILRFDDTNPATATKEFEDSFIRDLALLKIKYAQVTHTSEHFPMLIEWCEKLLASGDLYVDSSTDEEIKAQRAERKPSPFRDTPPEDNLARWRKMVDGVDIKSVVRAKIDYAHDVGCLRDPNMFRSAPEPHYRTGAKFKVYPLYDFACPIVDSFEGITHAFRSNEYHDRDALYRWVQEKTGVRRVQLNDFGRLSFSYTLLSKRKLAWFVKQGLVDGWNHPAFPTVQGLFRRGMLLKALREFVTRQGATSNTVLIDSNDLWSINRIYLEPSVPRYFAINSERHYTVTLTNYAPAAAESKTVPLYRKNPEMGSKVIMLAPVLYIEAADGKRLQEGSKVTLMGWGNAVVTGIDHQAAKLAARLDLADTDFSSTAKLSWVPDVPDQLQASLVDYKTLISKPSLSKGDPRKNKPADRLEDFANRDLQSSELVFIEGAVRSLPKGTRIQLERRGYYILDQAYNEQTGQPPVFIHIPEGRTKTMQSKE